MKKIYNEYGFLQSDAKAFVNDTFIKGLNSVLSTAENESDLMIIGSILSNIIGKEVLNRRIKLKQK